VLAMSKRTRIHVSPKHPEWNLIKKEAKLGELGRIENHIFAPLEWLIHYLRVVVSIILRKWVLSYELRYRLSAIEPGRIKY